MAAALARPLPNSCWCRCVPRHRKPSCFRVASELERNRVGFRAGIQAPSGPLVRSP